MEGLHNAGRYASLRAREPRQRLSLPPASWDEFCDRFHPMARLDGSLLWSGSDIPARIGTRHIWTVAERNGDRYLMAGHHVFEARGYVLTAISWPGLQDQQSLYAFPNPMVTRDPAPALGAQAGAP